MKNQSKRLLCLGGVLAGSLFLSVFWEQKFALASMINDAIFICNRTNSSLEFVINYTKYVLASTQCEKVGSRNTSYEMRDKMIIKFEQRKGIFSRLNIELDDYFFLLEVMAL